MAIVTLGLDLGKNWIHMVGLDEEGRIVLRRRVRRNRLLAQTVNMPACLIGMKACCCAHHLGRSLEAEWASPSFIIRLASIRLMLRRLTRYFFIPHELSGRTLRVRNGVSAQTSAQPQVSINLAPLLTASAEEPNI